MKEIRQPETIRFWGNNFIRIEEWKDLGNGVSTGPFYGTHGVDSRDWAFIPDLAFREGTCDAVSMMHVQQMRAITLTPRPQIFA